MRKDWEHYSHTADMGIRGFGESIEDAFANAAVALSRLMSSRRKFSRKQKFKSLAMTMI